MKTAEKQQPRLIPEDEQVLPCGYAPRVLLRSRFPEERLFVGCKDGSVAVIRRTEEGTRDRFTLDRLADPPSWLPRRRVRALCELDEEHLLVGRENGAVDVVAWRHAIGASGDEATYRSPLLGSRDGAEPVRFISRLGPERLLVTFGQSSRVFRTVDLMEALRSGKSVPEAEGQLLALGQDYSSTLRLAVRCEPHPEKWLLATSRGGIWLWDETAPATTSGRLPVKRFEDVCWVGETPGFVNDIAVMRSHPQAAAQAVFLATDIGIYFIDLRTGVLERALRLSPAGLGTVSTALTYTETKQGGFLWSADTQGNSHVFRRGHGPGIPDFQPSGIVDVGTQVVLALSWQRLSDESLIFAQARRNDTVAFGKYLLIPQSPQESFRAQPGQKAAQSSAERLRHYRHLLRFGTLDQLREELAQASREESPPVSEWPDQAILADFFELLAESDEGLRVLREFLSNPSARIGREILHQTPEDEIDDVVRLWVLTLLGIVNRMQGERETSYLGIVRWLRGLERPARQGLEPALTRAVQTAIRFARKWGLYGEANARRDHLVGPLESLRSQLRGLSAPAGSEGARWPDGIEHEPEALDLLTYEALLFHRGFDVLHQDDRGRMRGRTAWDLSSLEVWGRRLVAVSWTWGGVELFELKRDRQGQLGLDLHLAIARESQASGALDDDFSCLTFPAGAHRDPTESWHEYGHSRAVLLGKLAERCFLLTAPTLRDSISPERFYLWEIVRGEDGRLRGERCEISSGQEVLNRNESVYRLIELTEGRFVAGLRGVTGHPTVALLEIEVAAGRLAFRQRALPLPTSGSTGKSPQNQNRIWSLTRAAPRDLESCEPTDCHLVAVGCEGGEIVQLKVPHGRGLEETAAMCSFAMVAQMSSPVVALAYLAGYGARDRGSPTSRIFAGGADGSIVAWQGLADQERSEEAHPRFASLWATAEQGSIAAIHPLAYGPPGLPGGHLVIAVTRQGRCLVFDDRPDVAPPRTDTQPPHPQRPRFPGNRIGRQRLMGTAFASLVIGELPPPGPEAEPEPVWRSETGRYGLLLTASEHGRLRLISLHYAQWTDERRRQYSNVLELWWKIVYRPSSQHCDRLRLADALYQAMPLLPLLLVEWILDRWQSREVPAHPPAGEPPAWQVPRYLRQLLSLRTYWELALDPDQSEEFAAKAGWALEELLRRAWRREDLDLFQQLCVMALKRANFDIFRLAFDPEAARHARLFSLYGPIFEVVEHMQQRWLGAPERQEGRARTAVAKALIDGDTFWQVLQRAAGEEQAPAQHQSFSRILEKRIAGVRQLVFKRDPLVSLETLRALNLSLMRLCKRLVGPRLAAGRWQPQAGPSEQEAYWPVFMPYFEELTYAAARAFRSRLELNDSIAHEYCRTFALVVCACPSAAVRIANRMTETQLISDPNSEQNLPQRVLRQFAVLAEIGIPVPKRAIELFRLGSCPTLERTLNPVQPVLLALHFGKRGIDQPKDPEAVEKFGLQNAEDLFCLCRLYRVVDWIVALGEKLSTDAKGIDLTSKKLKELKKNLTDRDGKLHRLYLHSTKFWKQALASLESCRLGSISEDTIRPEMVLRSHQLADWARDQIKQLDRLYRTLEIFQPEYPIFREALDRLERAARDFPQSSAVQKNIVLAVFGHHLLEDLDEHVLELEELAQNLDPLMVWEFRQQRRALLALGKAETAESRSVAQRFAHYLLRRARHAESIPKNLRALHGILESPEDPESTAAPHYFIEQLLESFQDVGWKWAGRRRNWEIGPRAFQCLSLALAELESNQRKHSGLDAEQSTRWSPRISSPASVPSCLEIEFWFRKDKVNRQRLNKLKKKGLQEPLAPRGGREVPSTGAGLYLANLAASVVNWRLTLERVQPNGSSGLGSCAFRLLQLQGGRNESPA